MFTFREYGETMNVQPQPDLTEFEFALFAAILSAHQNRERIVGCVRAGGRVECLQAVGRVSAGLLVSDRRCAEDWGSLRARPCQMRRAVLFLNPFCTPGSKHGVQAQLPFCPQQNPTIHDWCRRKSFDWLLRANGGKKFTAGETHSCFAAMYR